VPPCNPPGSTRRRSPVRSRTRYPSRGGWALPFDSLMIRLRGPNKKMPHRHGAGRRVGGDANDVLQRLRRRTPYAGFNRIRFRGTFSIPRSGIPLAACASNVAVSREPGNGARPGLAPDGRSARRFASGMKQQTILTHTQMRQHRQPFRFRRLAEAEAKWKARHRSPT
jgi:hypothetical protein